VWFVHTQPPVTSVGGGSVFWPVAFKFAVSAS
jgi:hypothetical protein